MVSFLSPPIVQLGDIGKLINLKRCTRLIKFSALDHSGDSVCERKTSLNVMLWDFQLILEMSENGNL